MKSSGVRMEARSVSYFVRRWPAASRDVYSLSFLIKVHWEDSTNFNKCEMASSVALSFAEAGAEDQTQSTAANPAQTRHHRAVVITNLPADRFALLYGTRPRCAQLHVLD